MKELKFIGELMVNNISFGLDSSKHIHKGKKCLVY